MDAIDEGKAPDKEKAPDKGKAHDKGKAAGNSEGDGSDAEETESIPKKRKINKIGFGEPSKGAVAPGRNTRQAAPPRQSTRSTAPAVRESERKALRASQRKAMQGLVKKMTPEVKARLKKTPSDPDLTRMERTIGQVSTEIESLFNDLDAGEIAGGPAHASTLQKVESCLYCSFQFSDAVHDSHKKLEQQVSRVIKEKDDDRLKARYNVWIKLFHLYLCDLLLGRGVNAGMTFVLLEDAILKENAKGFDTRWGRPVHAQVQQVLADTDEISRYNITDADFEVSVSDRSARNSGFHGDRNEYGFDHVTVQGHYDEDAAELPTLQVPQEKKEIMSRIMRCVTHVIQQGLL